MVQWCNVTDCFSQCNVDAALCHRLAGELLRDVGRLKIYVCSSKPCQLYSPDAYMHALHSCLLWAGLLSWSHGMLTGATPQHSTLAVHRDGRLRTSAAAKPFCTQSVKGTLNLHAHRSAQAAG